MTAQLISGKHGPALRKVALYFCLGVIGFFLWTEHRAHFLGALPYLILLSCPLMHHFMHHGHKHDERGQDNTPEKSAS